MGLKKGKKGVTEDDVKAFVQLMGEENSPRFKKRDELTKKSGKRSAAAYWDKLAEEAASKEQVTSEEYGGGLLDDLPEEKGKPAGLPDGWMREPEKRSVRIPKLRPAECRNFVTERCELVLEAKLELERIKTEYQELTAYLTDIQKIDRIPKDERSEMDEAARHILSLEKEREKLRGRKLPLTDYQLKILERYEDTVPGDIKRLQEQERYSVLIKDDLRQLEGEKGSIQYEQEELLQKQVFLKRIGFATGGIIVLLFAVYTALMLNQMGDFMIPFLLTALCGAIMAAYIFLESRRNLYRMKTADKKWNRAVHLQNKVKVKYVNNTAALDYAYNKYALNHSRELLYRWELYVKSKDETASYQRNTELLRYYNETLVGEIAEYQVHDPQIWIYQAAALLDNKEMTEVRHRLNVRRQKLRDQLDYNTKVKETAESELRKFRIDYPEEKRRTDILLETHHLTL